MSELCNVKCNLCGANDYLRLPVKNIRANTHKKIKLVICNNCGLLYLNPRWTNARYVQFYQKEYRDLVGIPIDVLHQRELLQQMQLRGSRCLSFCHEFIGPNSKVLEVGCSNGGILRAFQFAGYKKLFGVEPNVAESQFARDNLGLRVVTGMLEDANFEPESFDLILIVASIDHFQDPLNYLQQMHKLSLPGGYLFVDAYDTLQLLKIGRLFVKMDHCYYFTAATLNRLLAKAGWETIKFERVPKFAPPQSLHGSPLNNFNVGIRFLLRKAESKIPVLTPNGEEIVRKVLFYTKRNNSAFTRLFRKLLYRARRFYA